MERVLSEIWGLAGPMWGCVADLHYTCSPLLLQRVPWFSAQEKAMLDYFIARTENKKDWA